MTNVEFRTRMRRAERQLIAARQKGDERGELLASRELLELAHHVMSSVLATFRKRR